MIFLESNDIFTLKFMYLFFYIGLPIVGIIILIFIRNGDIFMIKKFVTLFSILIIILTIIWFLCASNYFFHGQTIWHVSNSFNTRYVYDITLTRDTYAWVPIADELALYYKISDFITPYYFSYIYNVYIDVVSFWFILLTSILILFVSILTYKNIQTKLTFYFCLLFLLQFLLTNIFSVTELLPFYIFYEGLTLPMFLLIGIWGSTKRRIYAAFNFLIYTLTGSIFMFITIFWLLYNFQTTDIFILCNYRFNFTVQLFLFIAFFSSFAIKIPIFPFHLWLPEAHVEAPTGISVLLAGILLKVGAYGFLRFVLLLCPDTLIIIRPFLFTICIIGIIYSSLIALKQTDLKKTIAYASIGHMNMIMLGIFSGEYCGILGAVYLMYSHAIISSGLFICVGVLYDRYHTRIIKYYSGLLSLMPLFSNLFFLLMLGNIAFPITGNFPGEVLIYYTLFEINPTTCILTAISMILNSFYSLWLVNRTLFGQVNDYIMICYTDLEYDEFSILLFLVIFMFIFGLCIKYILYSIHLSCFVWFTSLIT